MPCHAEGKGAASEGAAAACGRGPSWSYLILLLEEIQELVPVLVAQLAFHHSDRVVHLRVVLLLLPPLRHYYPPARPGSNYSPTSELLAEDA